jgi:phosphoglucosamine mutase
VGTTVKQKQEMKNKTRLFGTDGIRGQVEQFPLDGASLVKLGCALGFSGRGAKIVIGRDTRGSGPYIEKMVAAGFSAAATQAGGSHPLEITCCGVIPTPGLSFVTASHDFDWGIMITASHNPYTDNGIKIFGSDGEKIPDSLEAEIEDRFFQLETPRYSSAPSLRCSNQKETYQRFLFHHASGLRGVLAPLKLRIILDCAHGAASEIAPPVFGEAGVEAEVIHAAPDGRNINRECGSTHMEQLKAKVIAQEADLGIAFDGDGDRVLFVAPDGRTLDGDYTLYLVSQLFLRTRLHQDFNKIVVGTVMGNLGLEKALGKIGITYLRTAVGDKYVLQEMKHRQAILGGEQSGHTILRSFQKTGDGILTALYFLTALSELGIKPADLVNQLTLYPQVTQSIRVKEKIELARWDRLKKMTTAFNDRYRDNSRLLVRYSGTEPIIRVMMEAEEQSIIDENLGKFADLIQRTIGA